MTAGALAIYYYEQDSSLSSAEWTAKVFEVFELSGIGGSISAGETLSERRFTNPESYKSELVSYGVDPDSI